MKKEIFSFSKRVTLLFTFFILTFYNSFSQCTNPIPVGNTAPTFCAIDNSAIDNLNVSGGTIVWFDSLIGGNQYSSSATLTNGYSYFAEDIDGGNCSPRLEVVVSIYGDVPSNVDVFVGKCASDNPTIEALSAVGNNIVWYDAQTNGSILNNSVPLVDDSTYWVQQTENGCISQRLPTTVNLINPASPTVDLNQSFCSSTNPIIGDLQAVESNLIWYDTETSTIPLSPTFSLIDGEDYWAAQTTFPCESTIRVQTIASIDLVPNAGTSGSYSECEIDLATTNLFELLGGSPENNGTWSGPSVLSGGDLGTFEPGINTEGTYTYTVTSKLGICASETASVNVTILKVQPPTTTETTQTFCEIDNPTVSSLSASGTGVLWYDTVNSNTPLDSTTSLINGEDYYGSQTNPSGCESATRLVITATIITPLPPTTSESNQTFCEIDNPTIAELMATGTGILWYDTETSTTPLSSSDTLINGENYWASQTEVSGCESATRLVVTVTITTLLPPTTTESNQSFCEIDNPTVTNLSATGTGLLWYDTETSTTPLNSTDALIDGEDYWASQTEPSGCTSANRLMVTATIIKPQPPTTTETSQSFCEIDNPTITELAVSGTNVLWYDTETSTTPLNASDVLIDGEDYWASQMEPSGCESISRLVVTASIIKPLPPTTTEATQVFCDIDNPTVANLTATGTGILWYDTEVSTTALMTTDALIDGKEYWASQTETSGGCESETRLLVTATIIVPMPPTTTETNQSFCIIDNPTVGDLTATGTGILWFDTETSTTPLNIIDALIDGEDYWASQTEVSGCESATRLVVTATIIVPLPPTTSETNQSFCEFDNATVANLSATGTSVLWYDTETSTVPLNDSDAIMDDEDYWASQTEPFGCESNTRIVVTATIIKPQPPTTLETTQIFCEVDNSTVADLTVTGTNVLWYDSEISTTPLNDTDALIDGEDYWASQTETNTLSCESVSRLVVTASIPKPLPPTTSEASQTFCDINNPTVGDLTATGTGVLWYDTETSTTPLNATDPLINGEDYWASQTNATGCESNSRLVVTANINKPTPPTTTEANQTFCKIEDATITNLTTIGTGILWYDSETSTTPLNTTDALIDNEDYWASQTDALGCESVSRLVVTATILDELPPTTTETTQTFCEIDNPIVANLTAIGTSILWYDSETSMTALSSTDVLIDGEDYWATQTGTSGCESDSKLIVNVSITATLPPTTSQTNQSFCLNDFLPNSPTVDDLEVAGTNVNWYISESSTTPLNGSDLLIDGQAYYASQNDITSCESATRLVVNVSIQNPPNATISEAIQTFCFVNNSTVADLQATGDTIIWFESETSITPLNATDALIHGEDYWALNTDSIIGCESASKQMVTVAITDVAAPTINNLSQTLCVSNNPTIASLQASGVVEWYALENDTTPLNLTESLINGGVYWAAAINTTTGCPSSVKVRVDITLTAAGTPILAPQGNEFCIINNPTLSDLATKVSASNGGGSITWYDAYPNGNILSLSQFLNNEQTYYAIETDNNGCSSLNPLEVTVNLDACDEYDITVYDGFSPNGDGINDTFKIDNIKILYPNYNVEIFNRWGSLMYTSDANKPDWNGRLNGDDDFAPSGIYYYIINFNKGDRKPIQGRLYLSR